MKRTLPLLMVLLLAVLLAAPVRALADEESVLIRVDTVNGEVDSTVDVEISLLNCFSVDSAAFDVNSDPVALAVVSVTPGDIFPAQYCVAFTDYPGRISIACARALGFSGDGILVTIRFRVLSDSGSALTLTTHLSGDAAGKEITWVDETGYAYEQYPAWVTLENGGVTVGGAALPAPAVTPWIPATPIPTPTPEPVETAAPTPAATLTASPEAVAIPFAGLIPSVYYVGGGLLLAVAVFVTIILLRKNKRHS
ncbi:MAG: cohesin domain-containing protein [Eubacteriales bacterium]|nr:cohesin domain-containing protein [Eubacteriales bacterium]